MWSAALFSLQSDLGRGVVDSLILQTNYSYAINIAMSDCAQLLIDADTLLYGGAHYCAIYNRLLEHGFVPLSEKSDCTIATATNNLTSAAGVCGLSRARQLVYFGHRWKLKKYTIQVLSITGQQVGPLITTQDAVYNYQNSNLSSAVYLVKRFYLKWPPNL